MLFLLESLLPWAAAALALGFAFGLFARDGRGFGFWGLFFALVYGAGLAVAFLDLAPGQYGFWLETGLMIFAAYAVGFACGAVPRRLFRRRKAPAPDWIGAAHEVVERARALAAAAPAAVAALEGASALFAIEPHEGPPMPETHVPAEHAPEPDAAPRQEAEAENDELRLIHGLDGVSARKLGGVALADLADWPRDRQAEAAARLGVDEDLVAYWAAQARLLAHGVGTEFSQVAEDADAAPLDAATARALSAALPQALPPQANDSFYPGARPFGLLAPAGGEADDLTRISGVDPAAARRLNALGIWTFRQIVAWTPDNARWIDSYLAAPGRIAREHWLEQAAALAAAAPIGV